MIALFVSLKFFITAVDILYDVQGIDDFDKIAPLRNSECKFLCKLVHRPGGHVVNPNSNDPCDHPTVPTNKEHVSMKSV